MLNAISLLRSRSPLHVARVARQLLLARWSLRHATSVGKYVRLNGRLRVENKGRLVIGDKVFFHAQHTPTLLVVQKHGELRIGDNVSINYGADICACRYIEIGDRCQIGTHCIILDNDFHHIDLERRDVRPESADVILEPDVWVGNRVTILKGVRIGHGSVISAGSVLVRSIPPMSIVMGVPARVIGQVEAAKTSQPQPQQSTAPQTETLTATISMQSA